MNAAIVFVGLWAGCSISLGGQDPDGDGFDTKEDCNEANATIHPGAPDQVGDGVDTNCDDLDGEDHDRDGHASVGSGGADCNDENARVHASQPEVCNGVDDDCDAEIDESLECTDTGLIGVEGAGDGADFGSGSCAACA